VKEGVLLLGGPTAAGKSQVALALAQRFGAEIIGADSRQIYAGMPIGTAAPPREMRERVPHHLVEILPPHERYSAARFAADALAVIEGLQCRNVRVIVAGGTGFYIRSLSGDVVLSGAFDPELRTRLAREASIHPVTVLHEWLATRDPRRAAAIEPGDSYRVTRALEVAMAGPAREAPPARSLREQDIPFLKVWLDVPADVLNERIERRVDSMLRDGFIEEARRVGPSAVAADAVGYPQAIAYLDGLLSERELRAALVRATRRYAKRQRTWFRAEPQAIAVDASDQQSAADQVAALARERLRWAETVNG
jgi:tRNA dimethylallyltransferase